MNTTIKQRLKTTILERRIANGLGDITKDSKQGKTFQMTEREKRMSETRQESNRPAKKARLKFEEYVKQGKEALQEENARNEELNTRLINFETHKQDIIDRLKETGVGEKDIAKAIHGKFKVDNQNISEEPKNNHEIQWTVIVLDSENITAASIYSKIDRQPFLEKEIVLKEYSNENGTFALSNG